MIYLLRHAEPLSDGERRYIGRTDLPLSPGGIEQAKGLGTFFADRPITAVYHSPLRRSRDTALHLAAGRFPLVSCEGIAEIHLGRWEGLSFREVRERFPDAYEERGRDILGFRPPEGESFRDCLQRSWQAWQGIIARHHENDEIVIVGHKGINRCLLSRLQAQPEETLLSIEQDYACLNRIRLLSGLAHVIDLNLHILEE